MDSDELLRIEFAFQRRQRIPDEVGTVSDMDSDVVPVRFQPIDVVGLEGNELFSGFGQ